jgi:hypothetical protein
MGGQADRQACADGERGPPSVRAEICIDSFYCLRSRESGLMVVNPLERVICLLGGQ